MGRDFDMLVSPAFGQVEVFVTNEVLDGSLGGLAGANAICTTAAEDAIDRILDAPINVTENRNVVVDDFVWTATDPDGRHSDSGHCVNWTSNDVLNTGQVGDVDLADAGWTDIGAGNNCDALNRIYCFADVEVPVELEEFSVE
jgi:hypothetical protein